MPLYIGMSREYLASEERATSVMLAGSGMFWLTCALVLTLALLCGVVGGLVFWRSGTHYLRAFLYGCGACGVFLGLGIAFLSLLV